ncbi:MAG: 4-(cytidine 5'-diphospho)-2-C-methyl-D-erythritol kinase, partial [Candidatus Cloacimonetes bacterium]|nr:4-(cytidine 5'-diphospho)-2-C-methyl-D-erythritol kinase [Candidatus Cloacimonadota bacterium]
MYTASYAKINLFLEITGKLANNYHQVNTVLCSIDLCDFISYSLLDYPEISLSCSNPALSGKENLVFRVAEHLQQRYCPSQGIKIHLEKHIPIAAGLGGGSSNAANCIKALNTLWQLNLPQNDLHEVAASFGSDINFFLLGGTALGTNRGEQVSQLPDIKLEQILLV